MRRVILEVKPFGRIELEIRGAVIAGETAGGDSRGSVSCEVLGSIFVPVVSASPAHVRAFGEALIETADAIERAIAGLRDPA